MNFQRQSKGLLEKLLAGLLLAAAIAGCAHRSTEPPAPQTASVRLVAINDFHGHLSPFGGRLPAPGPQPGETVTLPVGGGARLATLVHQLAGGAPRSVIVSAGDLVGASPLESSLFNDEPTIELMNQIGLEYSAVGNHEFDEGEAELVRLQRGGCRIHGPAGTETCLGGTFPGASFEYMAANVLERATGKPLFPAYAIKTFMVEGHPLKVGFIGAVLKGTTSMVQASGIAGLEFVDEASAINAQVPQLRQQGVQAIVLLMHEGVSTQGTYNDTRCPGMSGALLGIMDQLDPAVDVVISGHTHYAYNCHYKGRLLTSAASYGRVVTRIDLTIDTTTDDVLAADAENYPVIDGDRPVPTGYSAVAPEADAAALIGRYTAASNQLAKRVVGSITTELTRKADAAGQSTLGELIADGMLDATRSQGAQIALMNPGGVRQDLQIEPGADRSKPVPVTYAQLYEVQPFGNDLITMTLTGDQLAAALEDQFAGDYERIMAVSQGFSYAWDGTQPLGSRIVPDSLRLDGQPIKRDGRYRVTVNSFMAGGGDHYTSFTQGSQLSHGGNDLQATLGYLATHPGLSPPALDRVRRVDSNQK